MSGLVINVLKKERERTLIFPKSMLSLGMILF